MNETPSRQISNGVEQRFRNGAHRWDAIYSDDGNWLARTWDPFTRQNVRWRFMRTFEEMPDLRARACWILDVAVADM